MANGTQFLTKEGLIKLWERIASKFVRKDASGNVSVTGNATVTGNLTVTGIASLEGEVFLSTPINSQEYGATFGGDVDIMGGNPLTLWDEDEDMNAQITCGSDGSLHVSSSYKVGSEILATQSHVAAAVANAGHIKRHIVDSVADLPGISLKDEHTIYMVRTLSDEGGDTDTIDSFEEYMWINGKWEKTGSSEVDLSGYYTGPQTDSAISAAIAAAAIPITDIEALA